MFWISFFCVLSIWIIWECFHEKFKKETAGLQLESFLKILKISWSKYCFCIHVFCISVFFTWINYEVRSSCVFPKRARHKEQRDEKKKKWWDCGWGKVRKEGTKKTKIEKKKKWWDCGGSKVREEGGNKKWDVWVAESWVLDRIRGRL